MEALAGPEKIIAVIGAIVVGVFAHHRACAVNGTRPGSTIRSPKCCSALMALGCVLVILASATPVFTDGGA